MWLARHGSLAGSVIDKDVVIKKLGRLVNRLKSGQHLEDLIREVKQLKIQLRNANRKLGKTETIKRLEDKAIIWDDGYFANDDQANPYREEGDARSDVVIDRRQALANYNQARAENRALRKRIKELESTFQRSPKTL
jgi:hypothetical protein